MKKALILVDLQNDFMPGGALGIPDGDTIIPKINALQKQPFNHIIASKDWHPKNHCSFSLWPPHCIQNTPGAEFVSTLNTDNIEKVILKGKDPQKDNYSAFFDDELDAYLKQNKVQEVWIAGVATEYCVLHSALDALRLGYTVYVISDACKAIDQNEGAKSLQQLREKGAKIV